MKFKTKITNFLPQELTRFTGEWVFIKVEKVNVDSKVGYYKFLCISICEQLDEMTGEKHDFETLHLYHLENIFFIKPTFFKDQKGNLLAKYESKHYSEMSDSELDFLIERVKIHWLEKGFEV